MAEQDLVPASVLIVDDNPQQLVAVESVLSGLDLEIIGVGSGREALRELLRRSLALVLLDVNLPDMDGFEVAALMRQRRECQRTPIIFMTAYRDDVFAQRAYSLGAVDFIMTPVLPDVLRTKVSVFIDLYRQTQQMRRQAEHLELRASQLAVLARQLTVAEEAERRRIADLLHDDIQQLLSSGAMYVKHLGHLHPQLGDDLDTLADLLQETIDASRSMARELSPPLLRHGGLAKALLDVGARFGQRPDVECSVLVEDGLPPLTPALEAFLCRAAGELLLNVAKHASATRVRLSTTLTGQELHVVVEDDGCGFDAIALNRVSGGEHFGLGSIRQRLELFDGRLDIDQPSTGGSRVELVVGLGRNLLQPGDWAGTRGTTDDRVAAQPARIRVLICDDHELIRRGLRALLDDTPHISVVGEAVNGAEAIALVRSLEPDVVLMDLSMPEMDGLMATEKIVAAGSRCHVVAMSMYDDESMIQSVLEAGAFGFVAKTCGREQLLSLLRSAGEASRPVTLGVVARP
jgi:DNA-binding NarL/FixJ family response regulator